MDSLGRNMNRTQQLAGLGRLRRQRSQEWRDRDMSSSEDDSETGRISPSSDNMRANSLQYSDRVTVPENVAKYVQDKYMTPTAPPANVINNYKITMRERQGSPYPIESTNNHRGAKIQPSKYGNQTYNQNSLQRQPKNNRPPPEIVPRNIEDAMVNQKRNSIHALNNRGEHLTSDSSENSDTTYPESESTLNRDRLLLDREYVESPPEPAPPEIPREHTSLLPHHRIPRAASGTSSIRSGDSRKIYQEMDHGGTTGQGKNHVVLLQDLMSGGVARSPSNPACGTGTPNSDKTAAYQDPQNVVASHNRSSGDGNSYIASTVLASDDDKLAGIPLPVVPVLPFRKPGMGSTRGVAEGEYSTPSPFYFHKFRRKCSWREVSIFLLLLTVILTAVIAYLAAVTSSMGGNGSGCMVMLPSDAHVLASSDLRGFSQGPVTEEGTSASSSTKPMSTATTESHIHQVQKPWERWPAVKLDAMNGTHRQQLPPYGFWNLKLIMRHSSFLQLNFTVPRSAHLAVYGRRNVAPSITQYDFVKFIKMGGVVRERRDTSDHTNYPLSWHDDIKPSAESSVSWLTQTEEEDKMLMLKYQRTTVSETPDKPDPESTLKFVSKEMTAKEEVPFAGRRQPRSVGIVNISMGHFLDTGDWYFSIYNDDVTEHELVLVFAPTNPASCPNDCSSNGVCNWGQCDCNAGYEGIDCSRSICPVLCSNHGEYGGGLCHCDEGWKGAECDVPQHECELPDCSGHGACIKGFCYCDPGWKGPNCEKEDCLDPVCSGHGFCVGIRCVCKPGWKGANCSIVDQHVYRCLPDCSGHGAYDLETGNCVCDEEWTGADCSQVRCRLECGLHGHCEGGACVCHEGWAGDMCSLRICDERCQNHGECKNGTCVCMQGWNGKHCTLLGCDNGCHGHGNCRLSDEAYSCDCHRGWGGDHCSIPLETNCNDKVDNDGDHLVDCADSDCCSSSACQDHIFCLSSNDPMDVLLRKQPVSVTASFYQQLKFLIEENSVQSYAKKNEYSETTFWKSFIPRRVSVIRGRVVTSLGLGMIGVRVSVLNDPRFGFTLTRDGGWFDMLVNGGGVITLHFQRTPLRPHTDTVIVPWNQIVVIDSIVMEFEDDKSKSGNGASLRWWPFLEPCLQHHDSIMKPVLLSTWFPNMVGGYPGNGMVYSESQVLQESIKIPGSGLRLVYHSNHAQGYLATLLMHLTGPTIPNGLALVHLHILIQGNTFEKTFEAEPNITYTYVWDRRNVYKQKVYGVTTGVVRVGYVYSGCSAPVWYTQAITMQGFHMDISDIGGWNLDVHHRYNFQDGILQMGSGRAIHFSNFPWVVEPVIGNGESRPMYCNQQCNGEAKSQKLLAPVALTSGPDGSIYVGDYNLIRKVWPDGNVSTIQVLVKNKGNQNYYLCISPDGKTLYISFQEKYRVFRLVSLENVANPNKNMQPVIGSGERCIPGDNSHCGDGGPAKNAKLTQPKGLAVAKDGSIYLADGTNIRMIDSRGFIHTIIGSHQLHPHSPPLPCQGGLPAAQTHLQWPTSLAINPIDNLLYITDDRLVMKLTHDAKLVIVTGVPMQCSSQMANNATSRAPITAISFDSKGRMFFAENPGKQVSYIKVMTEDGRINHFAGIDKDCRCLSTPCDCELKRPYSLAESTVLSKVTAITVSPADFVFVADQGNPQVLNFKPYLPVPQESGDYQIPHPATNEIYTFNRYGQHVSTRDMRTGKSMYSFLYNINTSTGKLSHVSDVSGNKVSFLRDSRNKVNTVENSQGQKFKTEVSRQGLEKFYLSESHQILLEYKQDSGLLESRSDSSGEAYIYEYDSHGRLTVVVAPTGEMYNLRSRLVGERNFQVTVKRNGQELVRLEVRPDEKKVTYYADSSSSSVLMSSNSSFVVSAYPEWGTEVPRLTGEVGGPDPLLLDGFQLEAEVFQLPNIQSLTLARGKMNKAQWTATFVKTGGEEANMLQRYIKVNNETLLTSRFDQKSGEEVISDERDTHLLTVHYSPTGRPVTWRAGGPRGGGSPLNLTYDRFGRLNAWSWGKKEVNFEYTKQGYLAAMVDQDGTKDIYSYEHSGQPSKVVLPSGRVYTYTYDKLGGIKYIQTPRGGRHVFAAYILPSMMKFAYVSPGMMHPYVAYFDQLGRPLQVRYPHGVGATLYRFTEWGHLKEIVHGDCHVSFSYHHSLLRDIIHVENGVDYKQINHYEGKLLTDIRYQFGPRTGLSNAKFTYEYDNMFRVTVIEGRVGGQDIPRLEIHYSKRSGAMEMFGQFRHVQASINETLFKDGTATFLRETDAYFRVIKTSLKIHKMDVFGIEYIYDNNNRITGTRTYVRNPTVSAYVTVKNFTYDTDGQLEKLGAQEPWNFTYDENGNIRSMSYHSNPNPLFLEYDHMDRIVKFGGDYKYDNRGFVVKNARDEKYQYNAKGLLTRAFKQNRFDIHYFYDYRDRLIARKDNYGNVTQFFYTDPRQSETVTHIFSPRNGKLISLIYDDQNHLIFAQIRRRRYYVATDQCGTPEMLFSHDGEVVREMVRGPFGHILYDSNPYLYLPIDFCGGLLDKVTGLVHMPRGKIYDPLLGQFLTPSWKEALFNTWNPRKLHLYRINGNDPVNLSQEKLLPTGHLTWLENLGFQPKNMLSQFFSPNSIPLSPLQFLDGGQHHRSMSTLPDALVRLGYHLTHHRYSDVIKPVSGFLHSLYETKFQISDIPVSQPPRIREEIILPDRTPEISTRTSPLGHGVTVSVMNNIALVNAIPSANKIYQDVFTTVLNGSRVLTFHSPLHSQEAFYVIKENLGDAGDDLNQLNRLSGMVNIEVHEPPDKDASDRFLNAKIHIQHLVLNIRYGSTEEAEEDRLLKHAHKHVAKEAWKLEKEALVYGFITSKNWTSMERDEIMNMGRAMSYSVTYKQDITRYPELAKDPLNTDFINSGLLERKRRTYNTKVPFLVKELCRKESWRDLVYNWVFLCK